jgi:hypothetical protein
MSQFAPIFQSLYPNSFEFLSAKLPQALDDLAVRNAFLANSHLALDEARSAVAMNGSNPLVFPSALGPAIWGQFLPSVPNRIQINREVFEHFEDDHAQLMAQEFLRTKILHEMCHWGCALKGVPDPDTAGETFETTLFQRELSAWWPPAAPAPEAAVLAAEGQGLGGPDVFTDADARAALLRALLSGARYAPGKNEDPQHLVFGGIDVGQDLPRGYRNNNPGNIRIKDRWMGLAEPMLTKPFQQQESAFCVFAEPEWGLRAIGALMRTYKLQHGLRTPRAIISRWAPASDNNDVASYATAVAKVLTQELGVQISADDFIDIENEPTLIAVMKAIARHENGLRPPYAQIQFVTAVRLMT